jgi:single-stranded-DNA-specific exonuclease
VEGFSLFDAIHKNGDLFTKYGGHPMAAGFTMKRENVGAFRRAMQEYAASLEEIPAQTVYLDCELQLSELSLDIPRELLRMEPFGCDNPQPTFGLFGVTLEEMMAVGEGKHMRLTLQKDGITVTAMLFNTPWDRFPYQKGDKLDAAVQLFAKTFRGQEQLSVVVRDIRISGLDENQMIADYALYERYKRRETLTAAQAERLLPTRDDFAKVYRLLRKTKTWDGNVQRLLKKVGGDMPLCRLLVILQAMHQCRLIRVRAFGDRMRLSVLQVAGKVEIATAPIILEIHRLTKGEGTNA